jgi:hypothetical protein
MTSFLPAAPAIVLALWILPTSQATPDFSGTWTMDLDRSESPHQGTAFEPVTYVIAQSPTEVVIETRRGSGVSRTTYPMLAAAAPDQSGKPGAARATGTVPRWSPKARAWCRARPCRCAKRARSTPPAPK